MPLKEIKTVLLSKNSQLLHPSYFGA